MVGVAGFEPATPTSRTWCATRLRYTPTPRNPREAGLIAAGVEGRKGRIEPFSQLSGPRKTVLPAAFEPIMYTPHFVGASPSGKAAVFGTAIPRFESWRPSHLHRKPLPI